MSAARVVGVDEARWDDPAVGRYMRGLAELGPMGVLDNATVSFAALELADGVSPLVLPVGRQNCWLTALSVAYGQALRDEIDRELGPSAAAGGARAATWFVQRSLEALRADEVVYVNHLLFSTSLHGRWRSDGLPDALEALRSAFPGRAILWRSLNAVDHAGHLARMRAEGACLLPSRVVWRLADPAAQWSPRTDAKADLELLERQQLVCETSRTLSPAQLRRVLDLYTDIYLAKYSRTNPAYTPAALAAAVASGVLRLEWVRDRSGEILAFAADQVVGGELTGPLLGHDRTRPQSEGLYRIAMALSVRRALAEGLSVNYSAGAGVFKRNRGATPALEFTAVFDDHLPPWRRAGYAGLAGLLRRLVPELERRAVR